MWMQVGFLQDALLGSMMESYKYFSKIPIIKFPTSLNLFSTPGLTSPGFKTCIMILIRLSVFRILKYQKSLLRILRYRITR